MKQPWQRAVLVALILAGGGLWVLKGKVSSPALAPAKAQADMASPRPTEAALPSEVTVPWAEEAGAVSPLLAFIKDNPSPLGQKIQAALQKEKAVVLVSLPDWPAKDPLHAWIKECKDYCKVLSTVIPVDLKDPQEKKLWSFLQVEETTSPLLVSIALSGEVKSQLTGEITCKQVIDFFAEVTGSCGVQCENGC